MTPATRLRRIALATRLRRIALATRLRRIALATRLRRIALATRLRRIALAALACAGCRSGAEERPGAASTGGAPPPADQPAPAPLPALDGTPNSFYAAGTPTFVLGTAAGERADREIAAQVALASSLFPGAATALDTSIDPAGGPAAWPARPVLYGGPHAHALLAALAPSLPFEMTRGRLVIGGQTFDGDDIRLIAAVPARAGDQAGPGYPAFLLYAGTGDPGVVEINAVRHGGDPILVADTFGPLATGRWHRGERGVTAVLSPLKPRIEWRAVERRLEARGGDRAAAVQIRFPAQLPAAASEDQVVDAALKGLSTAVRRLELAEVAPLSIYVYPDRRSKQSLTGDAGDGHAVPADRAVHVIATGDTAAADLEGLIAHEGTHVLAHAGWGPAGSPLLGEGLAVWVSGRYGGAPLSAWRGKIGAPPPLASLLGPGFRRLPEQEAYPVAGLLVDAAIARAGIAAVRDHLLAATPETWDAACKRAGLSSAELEADLARGASR